MMELLWLVPLVILVTFGGGWIGMRLPGLKWEQVFIVALTFVLGMVIGHVQESKWTDIREKALKKQIEDQECSDVNPFKRKDTSPHDSPRNSEGPKRES